MPVRLGLPQYVSGLNEVVNNPIYATAVGLLLYGKQQQYNGSYDTLYGDGVKGVWSKMRNWFQGNF